MPDAIITSTESTFGTISGTFAADQSTISGTVTGIVAGTLSGSVGVPGPAGAAGAPGQGVPVGGTSGQFLQKTSGADYATDWVTVNLAAYAPLNSPLFTGDPRGPTAALGDNDTSLATTAFVQQELLSGTANAKNLEVYVRNQTGSTIPAGSIVYINGATGNRPTVTLAQANNDANSAQTFGFTKTAIANNGFGYVIVRGELENINTSALTEGVQLYLSPTTAGTWTTTKPSAPQHLVYVGICVRAHPTQGVILVAVQNGYELPELHDVKITSPTNGQVLKYDSAQSLWVNGTDASGVAWGAITGTLTSQTDLNTALGLKYDASNPSGFITASALTPYLTSATAASTYQTISGMSSYLTTASAASTYQTQSGMSDYLSKAGNLAGLTNTGTARTNLGLGTIATVNDAPSDGSTYGRNNGAWVVAGGGGSFPADALTTNEVNAVADAEYVQFSVPATVAITYGSGVLSFYDSTIGADGKLITISGGSSFALSSGSSWGITLMTDTMDPGYPKYVEDLVGFINGQSVSLTATWTGTSGTDTVDGLTSYSPLELNMVPVGIQSGDRLMIEQGLRQYLTSSALSLSAAANSVLTYAGPNQNNIVAWSQPWQLENYATVSLVSTKANSANAALTGNVTINTNSSNAALFITQLGTGNILTLYDQAADTTFVAIDQNGKVNTIVADATTAGLNVPHGTAPTTPLNGDIWTTTTGLFMRQSGVTKQYVDFDTSQTINGNKTFSNATQTLGNSTATGTISVASGATISASTKTVNIGTGGVVGSTTLTTIGPVLGASTTSIGNTTAASTLNLATGATLTATTKAVNIGTSGVAGSTTNIAIGSTTGTSTTTLQGTTNGVTAAADTNSVALATTAYVVGQAGSATPLVNGTAAVGTSLRYARQDHVHPTDTSRAPLASPTFTGTVTIPAGASISGFAPLASPSLTGTPTSTTAAVDTNTTQIATTAFVVAQASAATPLVDGTAAVGTSLRYARADHVHPTDTSRAALNSPAFTGTPSLPTGTTAVTQTAGNNTTAVATTAFVTAAVPAFATTAEMASPSSTTKVVAPFDVVRMVLNRATFDTQNSSPTFATSGAGATAYKMTNDRSMQIGTPNVGVAGYGQMIYDTTAASWGILGAKRGDNFYTQDWSKRIWMSGTHTFTAIGDANTTAYCMLGGRNTVTTGNPSNTNLRGIGWKLVGGGTALKLLTFGWNGSAVVNTETTSSFTPVANQSFDWMIMTSPNPANPATSFCYLYVNDALVATGINAPADATVNFNYFYHSFESTASMATRLDAIVFPVKFWWSKS